MHQGYRQHGSKRLSFLALAPQRLGQSPNEAGISPGRLNLNTHETLHRRATTVRADRLAPAGRDATIAAAILGEAGMQAEAISPEPGS